MKHIVSMSKKQPLVANAVGDIICGANEALRDLLTATGGLKPVKEFAADRCDLPGDNGPQA